MHVTQMFRFTALISGWIFALFLSTTAHAQTHAVRLSINNSSSVAVQPNAGSSANDLSIAYFAGDILGQSNRRVMQLRVADPVLCADFNTVQSDSNVRLRLVDSNQLFVDGGDGRGFRGALPLNDEVGGSRLIIDPADANKRVLNVATQATLKCSVFPSGVLPVIQAAASTLVAPEGVDLIFANGLETVVGTDLVTTISTPASARAGDAVLYTVRVQNIGTDTANNVQMRDFFRKPVVGSPNPGLLNGSWNCTAESSASCSQASGTGYIFQTGATLPTGTALTFNVTRTLSNASAPILGSKFRVQAAAFSQPSENEVNRNNNAFASSAIQVVNSVAPTPKSLSKRSKD